MNGQWLSNMKILLPLKRGSPIVAFLPPLLKERPFIPMSLISLQIFFYFFLKSRGLAQNIRDEFPELQKIHIPMVTTQHSINLANAVFIILYEAWRQKGSTSSL